MYARHHGIAYRCDQDSSEIIKKVYEYGLTIVLQGVREVRDIEV